MLHIPPIFTKLRNFPPIYVFFIPPYFEHDAFTHHALCLLDASESRFLYRLSPLSPVVQSSVFNRLSLVLIGCFRILPASPRNRNRKLEISTASTNTKSREPAYSQALIQSKIDKYSCQNPKSHGDRRSDGYGGWCLKLRRGGRHEEEDEPE